MKMLFIPLFFVFSYTLSFADNAFNLKKPNPFKIPKEERLAQIIKNYGNDYIQVTDLQFSGLHWNMGMVVFVNKDQDIYVKNHLIHLKTLSEDEEEEDDGEWEEEEKSEKQSSNKKEEEEDDNWEEEDDSDEQKELKQNGFKYSEGTIIVKENYAMKGKVAIAPTFLTIMIKREAGYDPKYNDWEYIQTGVDGSLILKGKFDHPQVKSVCADCHGNIQDRDYIFSTYNKTTKI